MLHPDDAHVSGGTVPWFLGESTRVEIACHHPGSARRRTAANHQYHTPTVPDKVVASFNRLYPSLTILDLCTRGKVQFSQLKVGKEEACINFGLLGGCQYRHKVVATGYSWFDRLLRNPRSGVQTPQVLGYSGMRVALNPWSGVQTPTRWSNPLRSGVGVPHVQSGYTLA